MLSAVADNAILRASTGAGGLKLGQALFGALSAILLARVLGPEGFGAYAFGLSVVTIAAIPIKNGLSELVVRELATASSSRKWSYVAHFLRWTRTLTTVYILCAMALIGGLAAFWSRDSALASATIAGLLILPGLVFLGLASGGLRALGQTFQALLPDTVLRPFLHMALVGLALLIAPAFATDPHMALALHAVAAAVCAGGLWLAFQRALPFELATPGAAKQDSRRLIGAALTFAAVGGLMVANRQIDLIVLGVIAGEEPTGLYRVAVQCGMLVTFGAQAVNTVVSPLIARNAGAGGRAEQSSLMRTSIKLSCAVAIPAFLALAFFGESLIVGLFGEAFRPAYPALLILAAANAVTMLNGAIVPLLNMTGHERATLQAFATATAANGVSALVLVPQLGLLGAAYAALISTLIWSFALRRASIRRLSIDPIRTLFLRSPT